MTWWTEKEWRLTVFTVFIQCFFPHWNTSVRHCCFPITWKIEHKLRGVKPGWLGGGRPRVVHLALHQGSYEKHGEQAHNIHRWLHNPRQMSKGLTWQPEHLWKGPQSREHGGFTDGYMCREMMVSPSQTCLYHLIFKYIKYKQFVCLEATAHYVLPFDHNAYICWNKVLERSKTSIYASLRLNQTSNCARKHLVQGRCWDNLAGR